MTEPACGRRAHPPPRRLFVASAITAAQAYPATAPRRCATMRKARDLGRNSPKSAIVTAKNPRRGRFGDVPDMTPEEHQGEAMPPRRSFANRRAACEGNDRALQRPD